LTEFVAAHGVWLVAAFIALESAGAPFPAEAALIAAAVFAANTHAIGIGTLIVAGVLAAVVGNVAGFWLGRRYGHRLLTTYGSRVGLTAPRIKIGQWLFLRYGSVFVFVARFLPFVRNMAAILAGANAMAQQKFYIASTLAALAWVLAYSTAGYAFGAAFSSAASPVAIAVALVAVGVIVGLPLLIVRSEKRLLARAERELPPDG
jgi:membrane protein DedA with SNARE-associated domain